MGSMAESEGFEPPVAFRLRLISSQVHSTGLCQLSALGKPRGPPGIGLQSRLEKTEITSASRASNEPNRADHKQRHSTSITHLLLNGRVVLRSLAAFKVAGRDPFRLLRSFEGRSW